MSSDFKVRRVGFAVALAGLLAPLALEADHWPRWRGPENDGMALTDAPTRFSETENVKWKIAIPGRGHSSPVIWENKLFVTTAIQVGAAPLLAAAGRWAARWSSTNSI